MQFELTHNVKSNIVVITFTNFNISKVAAKDKLFLFFKLIGGNNPLFELEWIFPSFITSHVISEIIHNTCFMCGGLMQDSILQTMKWESPDGGYKNIPTKLRVCSQCGHSHT